MVFLEAYFVINIFITLHLFKLVIFDYWKLFDFTESGFFKNTRMNWTGCKICFWFTVIFSPLYWILASIVWLIIQFGEMIYFLFHVGRK